MNDNHNGFAMQDRMKEETSEVIARKRRLSCFCGQQDRFPRNRRVRERSCFLTTGEALKMRPETANKCGEMAIGIQRVWKKC
jgi:hypothetical protein